MRITYGSLWPEEHFGHLIAQEFADRVRKESNNDLIVEITPPSPDSELTKDVIEGKLQLTSGHALQEYVPELALTYLPYLYHSFEHFREIWTLNSNIVSETLVKRAEQAVPIKILGYSLIGYRDVILRDGSISSDEDLKNLVIRVDGSESSISTFKAFGSNPITIEYHKVKEAFKKGEIQAAENSSFNLIYMEWYKECRNVSLTEHLMLLNFEIVNTKFWNSLSKIHQDIISLSMKEAVKKFSDTAYEKRSQAITELQDKYNIRVNKVPLLVREQLAYKVFPMKLEFIKKYNLEKEYEYILSKAWVTEKNA